VAVASALVAGAALSVISGCGDSEVAGGETGAKRASAGSTASQRPRGEISAEAFSPRLFDPTSYKIDNPWVAYKPGKRYYWRGSTRGDDGKRVPHRIVFTVTDMTKVINGVHAMVGWDRDFSDGELVETELIFFAQDRDGNVWHLGQYSEVFEGKDFVGGSAWLVGQLKGAKAGLHITADPPTRSTAYSQGFAPAPYYWDDWSKVHKTGQRTCVPVGCFRDVVVMDEYEPEKPGAFQLKYYARGVGNVRTGWRGSDEDREVLVLEKVVQLGPEELRKAREAVREHEARAYVYGRTEPARPPSGG